MNLNPVRPPLITCAQTLTHAINLVGERRALIGPKWDFSWLCATENDRLHVREVKTIWSHRKPSEMADKIERETTENLDVEGFFFSSVPLLPPSLLPSQPRSFRLCLARRPKKKGKKKNRHPMVIHHPPMPQP